MTWASVFLNVVLRSDLNKGVEALSDQKPR